MMDINVRSFLKSFTFDLLTTLSTLVFLFVLGRLFHIFIN